MVTTNMTAADSPLHRYHGEGSQNAFRDLRNLYLPMVYGTALRLSGGNTAEAEDVSQMVFADLVRKAPQLRNEASMGAWLHRHTCFLMKNEIRGSVRRRAREQTAARQWQLENPNERRADHLKLEDRLDISLECLKEPDRRALILRFFEGKSLREVGGALGIGDDAAQKRVTRALERLRGFINRNATTGGVSMVLLLAFLSREARAEVPESLSSTLPGRALKLAEIRRGPLHGPRIRTVGPLCLIGGAALGIILAGWFYRASSDQNSRRSPGSVIKTGTASPFPGGKTPGRPARPGTMDAVLARLRTLVREPATSENAAAIAELIEAVDYEDLPALAKGIEDTGITGILYRSFPALFRHWGDHDTPAAMDWLFRHVSDEELSFAMSPSWEAAFQAWKPKDPKALSDWYAACISRRVAGSGPFFGMDNGILLRIGRSITEKDPGNTEAFLASFPDDPSFDTLHTTLKSDLRNYTRRMPDNAKNAPAIQKSQDAAEAERAAPTPTEYPGLRLAQNVPDDQAAILMAENLRTWSRLDGPAALNWVAAHLDLKSAGTMLDEIVPVWAQSDSDGLRAWYLANKDLHRPVGGDSLLEKIIRALAVNDPAAATDFLVNQCGTLEIEMMGGSWGSIQIAGDIAAGLRSPDQCREVIALLKGWPSSRGEEIIRLEKAALSRWKRWDPAGAEAAATP